MAPVGPHPEIITSVSSMDVNRGFRILSCTLAGEGLPNDVLSIENRVVYKGNFYAIGRDSYLVKIFIVN